MFTHLRTALLALGGAALLALAPGSASAATVWVGPPVNEYFGGPTLEYRAGAGEANRVTVSAAGDNSLTVRDLGAKLSVGTGCSRIDAHTARCSDPAGLSFIQAGHLRLGDGGDRATMSVPAALHWGVLDVDGGAGNDLVDLSDVAGVDAPREGIGATVSGGSGDDHLIGGADDDIFDDGPGDDRLEGRAGADTFESGSGDDRIDGGRGVDTVNYSSRRQTVRVDLARHRGGGKGERDSLGSVENVTGGKAHDVLRGDSNANVLQSSGELFQPPRGPGDVLAGGGGNDKLLDFAGPSRLDGGPGRDKLVGVTARDLLRCGPGRDHISEFSSGVLMSPDCELMDTQSYRYSRVFVHGATAALRAGPVRAVRVCTVVLTLRSRGHALYGRARFQGRRRVRIHLTRLGRLAAARHGIASVDAHTVPCGTHDRWRVRL